MNWNLTSGLAGALALVASGCAAVAFPSTLGNPQQLGLGPAGAPVNAVRFGGGGGHGFAGGHGFSGGHGFGGGYGFRGGHGFHHGHDFRGGFGVVGVPYYDDEGCWWSRRYHRWVC